MSTLGSLLVRELLATTLAPSDMAVCLRKSVQRVRACERAARAVPASDQF